ncbi:MAG TPA: low molecular weight protein arginine phosphatase [Actinomycetota bacterium]|nr:low molecular weight protein arginine phosphatase [Actinomycetota bacterium]
MLRILLICTGNICRSPMALGFLADRSGRLLDGALIVRSAGTWARPGSPPTPEAEASVAERGIDISDHRSTPVSSDLIGWADLIITMTAEHRDEVLDMTPDADDRTFTLKELVALLGALPPPEVERSRDALLARVDEASALRASGRAPAPADADVVDPIGMSDETYRAVAWELEELTDALVRRLAGADARIPAGDGEG